MGAFFRMQLKIYFRLWSSYITPLAIGIFYIILIGLIKLALSANEVDKLVNSNNYVEAIGNFCMIASFIICTFVTQTFFYRYRREGIEYILYSKPIRRFEIYLSNVFASIIGLLLSMFLMGFTFFISKLIVPIEAKQALISSLSLTWAGLLCGLLGLGIASLVQNFVEMKVFQIIVGIIPIFGVLVMNFVKFAQGINVVKVGFRVASNPALLIPNKDVKDANDAVDNLNKRIASLDDLLIVNEGIGNKFENDNELIFNPLEKEFQTNKIDTTLDIINNSRNSLYSSIFFLNFKEYYFPLVTLHNRSLQNASVYVDYNHKLNGKENKYYRVLDGNGKLNESTLKKLKEKYSLDLKKQILFKTNNGDVFALSYNVDNFRSIFEITNQSFDPQFESFLNYATEDIQNNNFDKFKDFNNKVINFILNEEYTKKIKGLLLNGISLTQQSGLGLSEFLIPKDKNKNPSVIGVHQIIDILSRLTKYVILDDENKFNEEKTKLQNEFQNEKNEELKKINAKFSLPLSLLSLKAIKERSNLKNISGFVDEYIKANFDTKKLTNIQKTRLEHTLASIKEKAAEELSKLLWTINVFKIIGIQEDGSFATKLSTDGLLDYLAASKANYNKYVNYRWGIIKAIKLNNNLIEFQRKPYLEPHTAILITSLFSLFLIVIGYLKFQRKNFK
ncbi:Hypothetical protein, predicted transmembrane protein [Metamycoplasma auris 15026]|uniref:ABC-2 type transporter transmembrane domain-containing protein n=1 Tax=Metamycoplasma auris 15026 TaxID=1188233 RepID=N9TQY4_9BACT|nr:ABC transporter permease [Metamycoplasma auris]ENY68569.1 Hypothetical protein, predicted transmembrane protein [Metamycoplasma auris 15026]